MDHKQAKQPLCEVRLSQLPECWDSCGNCADDEFEVVEVLVTAGESVLRYQPLLCWEAGKVAFELPAPQAGEVVDVLVEAGDYFELDEPLVLIKASN